MASSPGYELQRLDFSSAHGLLDFLSGFQVSDDHTVSKQIFITAGLPFDSAAIQTRKFVREWVSALRYRLADPCTKWEGHLTLQQAVRRSRNSGRSGNAGVAVGEVAVLILSISKPEPVRAVAAALARS